MDTTAIDALFTPIRIGGMTLRNRIMMPPHGRMVGDLFGSEDEAERNCAYWGRRARDGVAWIDGINSFIDNSIIPPGFRPTGLGATIRGTMRRPNYRERAGRFAAEMHEAGAAVTTQFIMQGGIPHSPSGVLANYTNNLVPHVLDRDEIRWLIDEYAFGAREAKAAGLDGIEIHANHEDIVQLFLSPATNRRDDEYGGDFPRRLRFLTDIVAAMRAETGRDFVIGVRMNMDELFDGGYGADQGIAIARAVEATGQIDFFHGVIGNNWGAPSYIQPHTYGLAQWAELAGRFKRALGIPVVYTGRVTDPLTAARTVAQGHADVVGVARAMFADEEFTSKARSGRLAEVRPCVGCNDCLHGLVVENLPFGCAVNPRTGRETEPEPARAAPKRILVIGGGPAGMEVAALAAERGHAVALWERQDRLGGQLLAAAAPRENGQYARYIDWQADRLRRLGVAVATGRTADPQSVLAQAADVVVVATGARPRGHEAAGADLPFVVQGRDVLEGRAAVGRRVVVIAREDHMQPLTVASHLVDCGCEVRILYQTPAIAPLVGKYSIGAILAKLTAAGTQVRVMERVVEIAPDRIVTRNVYSGYEGSVADFDSVVLACGGESETGLHAALKGRVGNLHILGDAFAPRRLLFATRQAYELAKRL